MPAARSSPTVPSPIRFITNETVMRASRSMMTSDPPPPHPVHPERARQGGVEAEDAGRPPPPAPEARPRVGQREQPTGQAVPDPVRERRAEDEVGAVALLAEHEVRGVLREQPQAVRL